MADTIQVTFANLDEAKRALLALHDKVQAVTNDPEFHNIDAYWSIGPAKNALHDAVQNLKHCSESFGGLVNQTVAGLIQAGMAFQDADGNAVQYVNGTLRFLGSGVAIGVDGMRESGYDVRIYSADNRINASVAMNAEVNYAALAEIFIGRLLIGASVEIGGGGDARPVVSLPNTGDWFQ